MTHNKKFASSFKKYCIESNKQSQHSSKISRHEDDKFDMHNIFQFKIALCKELKIVF